MDKPTFADLASAQEAQNESKAKVKAAKTKLTDYFKENGLKRNEDYSKDKKHGKEIEKLENRVDKRSKELEAINEAVKSFDLKNKKPGKTKDEKGEKAPSKNLKYEYPDNITTPDARKKYRIEQRKLSAGDTGTGGAKPNKPKKGKATKEKMEEVEGDTLTETKGKKGKVVKETKEEETKSTKKGGKKVSTKKKVVKKKVEEDSDDDND